MWTVLTALAIGPAVLAYLLCDWGFHHQVARVGCNVLWWLSFGLVKVRADELDESGAIVVGWMSAVLLLSIAAALLWLGEAMLGSF